MGCVSLHFPVFRAWHEPVAVSPHPLRRAAAGEFPLQGVIAMCDRHTSTRLARILGISRQHRDDSKDLTVVVLVLVMVTVCTKDVTTCHHLGGLPVRSIRPTLVMQHLPQFLEETLACRVEFRQRLCGRW